jgi:Domain of unknown function (DUF4340)
LSPRAFIVLLALTAVALVGAVGVVAVQPRQTATDALSGDPMFNGLSQRIADLQKVAIQTATYKATWEKRDGKWVASDHGNFPAKDGSVATVVSALAAMTRVEPKTDNPDWYQYIQVADPTGKTDPAGGARVTGSAANGDVLIDTIVGSTSASIAASHSRGGTFVRDAGQAQSWLVEGTVAIPSDLADWFDAVISIPGTDVASVAVLTGDKTVFAAHKPDTTSGTYKIDQIDASVGSSDEVSNDTQVRNLVAGIVNVTVQDARSAAGLTPGNSARVDRYTMTNGMQLDVTLVDADGATWAIFKPSAPDGSQDAKAAAAKISTVTDGSAFKLDTKGATAGLALDVHKLVQPPGSQPGQGDGAAAPFSFTPGQLPPGFGQGAFPQGFGQGGALVPGRTPLIR